MSFSNLLFSCNFMMCLLLHRPKLIHLNYIVSIVWWFDFFTLTNNDVSVFICTCSRISLGYAPRNGIARVKVGSFFIFYFLLDTTKWPYQFALPQAVGERSCFHSSSPSLNIIRLFNPYQSAR